MHYDKLIFELSATGKSGYAIPKCDVRDIVLTKLAKTLRNSPLMLPCVSEAECVRHFTNLSTQNHNVDSGFYPLGSCTMKYNPRVNEDVAMLNGFSMLHPLQPANSCQGILRLLYELQCCLAEITGMDAVTLAPAAGAHGEYTGLLIIKKYHEQRKDNNRRKIIVPDSAHGTNPASAAVAGFDVVVIKSTPDGGVDLDELKAALSDEVAGLMLTNPSTLGLFEEKILEIAALVHAAGGLLYYDGANMNAIMGKTRPGDMGFDVIHLNLHKTFSAPHGGGGPGSGPVGVKSFLTDYLPLPQLIKTEDEYYEFIVDLPQSIGRIKNFYGNVAVLIKAYAYILTLGAAGLREASEIAVLNANYLKELLRNDYQLAVNKECMHEVVFAGLADKNSGVTTLDVAKRLIDYGYHPPTIYFPMIVEQAMMFEPTETESKTALDEFAAAMLKIAREAKETPEIFKNAPYTAPVSRPDEVAAARKPVLKYSGA
jgi:glycine dehydrogenase subunit 2